MQFYGQSVGPVPFTLEVGMVFAKVSAEAGRPKLVPKKLQPLGISSQTIVEICGIIRVDPTEQLMGSYDMPHNIVGRIANIVN